MRTCREFYPSRDEAITYLNIVRMLGAIAMTALLASAEFAAAQTPAAQPQPPTASTAATDVTAGKSGDWRGVCKRDLSAHCRGASGDHNKRQCLNANLTKLSATCQAALNERRQLRAKARFACRAEVPRFCKDVAPGSGGAELQCPRAVASQVGPDCAKALAGLKAAGDVAEKEAAAKSAIAAKPAPKN